MGFSFLVLAPFAFRLPADIHVKTLKGQWKGVLYIGALMALSIGLNNISLLDISLSLNQIIRSSIPVVTCILAIFVEKIEPDVKEVISLVILTVGVMIAIWEGTISGKPEAILFCIMSTLCSAVMMTFSGKLLSEKIGIVSLTFYTAPLSLLCLAPFMVWNELPAFKVYLAGNCRNIFGIILLSSVNAVLYNLVHSFMIKRISAVATTVVGEIKILLLLLLSPFFLNEKREFTPNMLLGCMLSMMGFCFYSQLKVTKYMHQSMNN
jgi:drug/metabolite transporter (DMT)-like permease